MVWSDTDLKGSNELIVQSGGRRWFQAERTSRANVLRQEESWEIQHADKKPVMACRATWTVTGKERRNKGGKVGTG